jgi:hypothetical protein
MCLEVFFSLLCCKTKLIAVLPLVWDSISYSYGSFSTRKVQQKPARWGLSDIKFQYKSSRRRLPQIKAQTETQLSPTKLGVIMAEAGRIALKLILEKYVGNAWTAFSYFRVGLRSDILWIWCWTSGFNRSREFLYRLKYYSTVKAQTQHHVVGYYNRNSHLIILYRVLVMKHLKYNNWYRNWSRIIGRYTTKSLMCYKVVLTALRLVWRESYFTKRIRLLWTLQVASL